MLGHHRSVFLRVAEERKCWIGLRAPNAEYERWVAKAGYIPKHLECKAKTCDNPDFEFAGLVADPNICPQGFLPENIFSAQDSWRSFAPRDTLPVNYSVVATGPEHGLVQYKQMAFIHSDFDLMTLVKSNRNGDFLETSLKDMEELFQHVQPSLNQGLGTPMIQHPAEFMWLKGTGARSRENVIWFGPGQRLKVGESSIQELGQRPHVVH